MHVSWKHQVSNQKVPLNIWQSIQDALEMLEFIQIKTCSDTWHISILKVSSSEVVEQNNIQIYVLKTAIIIIQLKKLEQ